MYIHKKYYIYRDTLDMHNLKIKFSNFVVRDGDLSRWFQTIANVAIYNKYDQRYQHQGTNDYANDYANNSGGKTRYT